MKAILWWMINWWFLNLIWTVLIIHEGLGIMWRIIQILKFVGLLKIVKFAEWYSSPLKLIIFLINICNFRFFELEIIIIKSDIITCQLIFSQLTIGGIFFVDFRKVKMTDSPRNDFYLIQTEEKILKNILV